MRLQRRSDVGPLVALALLACGGPPSAVSSYSDEAAWPASREEPRCRWGASDAFNYYFPVGSSEMNDALQFRPDSLESLVVAWHDGRFERLRVRGYVSPADGEAARLHPRLGTQRATAVAARLRALGMPSDRLEVVPETTVIGCNVPASGNSTPRTCRMAELQMWICRPPESGPARDGESGALRGRAR